MVKSVISEESRLNSAEDRLSQSGLAVEVGLVVGKLNPTSDRGFIYDLIPTPSTEAGDPACSLKSEAGDKKKGLKGGKGSLETSSSILIDSDWIAEHARQVSRMLLGGMGVIGIYLWSSEAAFKATPPATLSQVIRGVGQAASSNVSNELLLLHVSYSPRRSICRICTVSSGNLRPCDFKTSKLLASVQAFRCMYNFEIRLPVFQLEASDSHTLKNFINKGINNLSKDLQSAKALINGKLVTDDLQSSSENINEVEFLLPFTKHTSSEACSSGEVTGLVVFSGSVCAISYLAPREPVSQAISDLKADIISSLRSRVDIITDEGDGEVALSSDGNQIHGDALTEKGIHQVFLHDLRKPYCLSFPRRVLIPWISDIFLCDYLQSSETFEDINERCKDILFMEASVDPTQIVEPENMPGFTATRTFSSVAHEQLTPVDSGKSKHLTSNRETANKSKSSDLNVVLAILFAVFALLFGWAFTNIRSKN